MDTALRKAITFAASPMTCREQAGYRRDASLHDHGQVGSTRCPTAALALAAVSSLLMQQITTSPCQSPSHPHLSLSCFPLTSPPSHPPPTFTPLRCCMHACRPASSGNWAQAELGISASEMERLHIQVQSRQFVCSFIALLPSYQCLPPQPSLMKRQTKTTFLDITSACFLFCLSPWDGTFLTGPVLPTGT